MKKLLLYIKVWYWFNFKIEKNEFHHSLDIFSIKDPIKLVIVRDLAHDIDSYGEYDIISIVTIVKLFGYQRLEKIKDIL